MSLERAIKSTPNYTQPLNDTNKVGKQKHSRLKMSNRRVLTVR